MGDMARSGEGGGVRRVKEEKLLFLLLLGLTSVGRGSVHGGGVRVACWEGILKLSDHVGHQCKLMEI